MLGEKSLSHGDAPEVRIEEVTVPACDLLAV